MIFGRATYDFLALLGDVGGLEGIVLLICGALISKTTSFLLTAYMIPSMFYYRKNAQAEDIE